MVQAVGAGFGINSGDFQIVRMGGVGELTPEWKSVVYFKALPGAQRHEISIPKAIHFTEPSELQGEEILDATGRFLTKVRQIISRFDGPASSAQR